MKRSTERRILLAILLSSLIPVLALGLFTAGAVFRMGQKVEEVASHARLAQARNDLHLRCVEKGEDLSVFLRGRADDLRALSLLPPTPANYRTFYWNTLSPLTVTNGQGDPERIWLPLYSEIMFLDAAGTEVVAVRGGEPVPDTQLGRRPELALDTILMPAHGIPRVAIAPQEDAAEPGGSFNGVLTFSLPLPAEPHRQPGTVRATLDPRHLLNRLLRPTDQITPSFPELRVAFFFAADGKPLLYPPSALNTSSLLRQLLADELTGVVAVVREGESGVIAGAGSQQTLLAHSPIRRDTGPAELPQTVGGVVLAADLRQLSVAPATNGVVASLTRSTELQIASLTVISLLCVALAALFVAQRMAQPWVRLREKVRAVADAGASGDELSDISRSFDSLASQMVRSAGRLRASEKRLGEFIEMNPDGIAVTGPDGRILHANHALCQMLRRTPTELDRHNIRQLWSRPADWDEILDRLRVVGRLKSHEGLLQRGDGSSFPALLTLRLHGHGEDESIDLIARDISDWKDIQRRDRSKTETLFRVYGELSRAHQELRQAYDAVEDQVRNKTAELRQAYEALQASDRVKTEFLMNMSHELRTPLNCIIGYSDAMIEGLDGPVSAEQADSLERIADSGRRLLRLIENLLDLARIETGHMEITCLETRVEDAIEDVLHQTRSLVGERPIRLEVSLAEDLPSVWADPDRLRQVLFNLVGNALKFTETGTITIGARPLPAGGVEVRVADTGPGIPAEQLDSIFDRFVQLPGTDGAGAGLGLAICREIVENMGGKIRAESRLGRGSVFTFTVGTSHETGQLALPFSQEDGPDGSGPAN